MCVDGNEGDDDDVSDGDDIDDDDTGDDMVGRGSIDGTEDEYDANDDDLSFALPISSSYLT